MERNHNGFSSASGGTTTRHQSVCGSQFKVLGKEVNSKQDLPALMQAQGLCISPRQVNTAAAGTRSHRTPRVQVMSGRNSQN